MGCALVKKRHDLGDLEGGFAQAFTAAEAALHAVLADRAVWAQEHARLLDAEPLPWPLILAAYAGDEAEHLQWLAKGAVALVLSAPGMENQREDASDPHFQTVLRVVKRAVDAAAPHLVGVIGRQRHGFREFMTWLKTHQLKRAIAGGMPVEQAADAVGISRSSAYKLLRPKDS